MIPPIAKGERVVVNGNLERYAQAFVADCVFNDAEDRWCIYLMWPNVPNGPGSSRVWNTDENNGWYRYAAAN